MSTYRVRMDFTASNVQVEVEAENEQEAHELAETAGAEIARDWIGCSRVRSCECLKPEPEQEP